MYEIRPDSIKTFISDRSIRLPRFQRKQTWDAKKNFQLCISLFKNYPIGVCILSAEQVNGKPIKYLLDGRQRRNALRLLDEDPENLYDWARAFIKFKPSIPEYELKEKFYAAINDFLEEEEDDASTKDATTQVEEEDIEDVENDDTEVVEEIEDEKESATSIAPTGIDLLLKAILLIHSKTAKKSGFTAPFDFSKFVEKLEYVETTSKGNRLSSRGLKSFINNYRDYCSQNCFDEYDSEDNFLKFINQRFPVSDEKKLAQLVHRNWLPILDRINILQQIDDLLADSKIGVIEVKGMKSTDYQKIFNLINSQGEPLKAVEILSSKQKWNIKVDNPSPETFEAVKNLYREIGTNNVDSVVRWDLPATFLRRISTNFVFPEFSSSTTDFVNGLTIGFKVVSGIYTKGVTKECIEDLSASKEVKWDIGMEDLISSVKTMLKIIQSYGYFKYYNTWRCSIMGITSNFVAMNFFILSFLNWKNKGEPIGADSKTKQFQKECFILLDRLIFEYVKGQWKSSADSKIRNNIASVYEKKDSLPDCFKPVPAKDWEDLLLEIFNKNKIEDKDITFSNMKPLLYHFYCLNQQSGPAVALYDALDIDHIIPQVAFENSTTIENKDVIKDNLLNLGILPKEENVSKNKRRLQEIKAEEQWLKDEIERYEFIQEADFAKFSNVNNYQEMFDMRKVIFLTAYGQKRTDLLNN